MINFLNDELTFLSDHQLIRALLILQLSRDSNAQKLKENVLKLLINSVLTYSF
jgi:hypothetical protein